MQILTPKGEKAQDLEEERLGKMLRHWGSLYTVRKIMGAGWVKEVSGPPDKLDLAAAARKILSNKAACRAIALALTNRHDPKSKMKYLEILGGLAEFSKELEERVHAGKAGVLLP